MLQCMKTEITLFFALACACTARAAIHTETVEYKHGDTLLEGHLVYDDATKGPRPGVLIVHQWKGLTDYEQKRVAAIGYCFGGTTIIELARSGAEIAGVVSFHGALDSPRPEDGKNIRCKVLALHGADDPFVPAKDVAACEDELRNAGVDWQLVKYGGAVQSFTDWNADGSMKGAKYDERADKRSWEDMKLFFAEIFR